MSIMSNLKNLHLLSAIINKFKSDQFEIREINKKI